MNKLSKIIWIVL